jgi:Protein of unknown function (DUF2865)
MKGWAPAKSILGALAGALLLVSATSAQGPLPVQPDRNPACARLEGQLSVLDRPGGDPQVRQYEEAIGKQQAELERASGEYRRMGCQGSGFFLFGGGQPPQCDQLNMQIQRMRSNIERMTDTLQRAQGGSMAREEQRRAILVALSQNNCGPQYRTAAVPQRPRGLFDSIFAPDSGAEQPGEPVAPAEAVQAGTFRTLCVRTCDGYYFPVSTATSPARFADDERKCQRMCPAAEVALYSHRNPGEDIKQATSTGGKLYTELATAFRYRQEVNASCTCKRPGESWAAAVGEDPTVQSGDIVVTEEKAKALSQPPQPQGKPAASQPQAKPAAKPQTTQPAKPAPPRSSGATTPPPAIAGTIQATPLPPPPTR